MAYQNLCYGLPPTSKLVLHILLVIFLLIAIFNSSLLNPGPNSNTTAHDINLNKDGLSFYYQNVQGLIPFTDLGKEHPNLDHTKIAELQQYVYTNSPDIVILNETWLKNNIILLYCAQNYYRTFFLVNSDEAPSIIFCTVQQYTIIIKNDKNKISKKYPATVEQIYFKIKIK